MQKMEFNQFSFNPQHQQLRNIGSVTMAATENNRSSGLEIDNLYCLFYDCHSLYFLVDAQQPQMRKLPSTYVPSFEPADRLFLDQISRGSLFDRLFDVPVTVTVNNIDMNPVPRIL